jgi:hypothetical protein
MHRRITAVFLILVPVAFNAAFFALGSAFNYPNILRQPTDVILQQFAAGGAGLVALWYLFAVTALLAVPLALLLSGVFREGQAQTAQAAAIIGVLSGLVQAFGLLRWVFLVPGLAATYLDPSADPALRAASAVVFEGAHRYLGVALGEHLGYLFTGAWTLLLSVMILRSRTFRPWLGIVGLVAAAGILVGLLEPAGWSDASAINAISYILWSLWLITLGILLFAQRAAPAPEKSPMTA